MLILFCCVVDNHSLVFWNHHQHAKLSCTYVHLTCNLQLFLERLSEKVHATIPKGTVGDFEVTVLQRKSR